MKQNCWEFKACGREPGGLREKELGSCPACMEQRLDGIHGGLNGGRSCWVVPGTFCDDKVKGARQNAFEICTACDFYKRVRQEEQHAFVFSGTLLTDLIDGTKGILPPGSPL